MRALCPMGSDYCPVWPNALQRPPTTSREVLAFDRRVSCCVTSVGHIGDPGTERWSLWRLSEAAWQRSLLALASGRSFALHGHLSFSVVRCVIVLELGSAIGIWGEAMCIVGSTSAEDFCCHMTLPQTTHRLLPFLEPFGSTPHHTHSVCVRVCACASVRVRLTWFLHGSTALSVLFKIGF